MKGWYPERKLEFMRRLEGVDTVVMDLIEQIVNRAEKGKLKYGTDLDRTDLNLDNWFQHSIEEQLDNMLYMTKIKQELKK